MQVGDLIKYIEPHADMGVGLITEERMHGGYWAYFPMLEDYYPVTDDYADWVYVYERNKCKSET